MTAARSTLDALEKICKNQLEDKEFKKFLRLIDAKETLFQYISELKEGARQLKLCNEILAPKNFENFKKNEAQFTQVARVMWQKRLFTDPGLDKDDSTLAKVFQLQNALINQLSSASTKITHISIEESKSVSIHSDSSGCNALIKRLFDMNPEEFERLNTCKYEEFKTLSDQAAASVVCNAEAKDRKTIDDEFIKLTDIIDDLLPSNQDYLETPQITMLLMWIKLQSACHNYFLDNGDATFSKEILSEKIKQNISQARKRLEIFESELDEASHEVKLETKAVEVKAETAYALTEKAKLALDSARAKKVEEHAQFQLRIYHLTQQIVDLEANLSTAIAEVKESKELSDAKNALKECFLLWIPEFTENGLLNAALQKCIQYQRNLDWLTVVVMRRQTKYEIERNLDSQIRSFIPQIPHKTKLDTLIEAERKLAQSKKAWENHFKEWNPTLSSQWGSYFENEAKRMQTKLAGCLSNIQMTFEKLLHNALEPELLVLLSECETGKEELIKCIKAQDHATQNTICDAILKIKDFVDYIRRSEVLSQFAHVFWTPRDRFSVPDITRGSLKEIFAIKNKLDRRATLTPGQVSKLGLLRREKQEEGQEMMSLGGGPYKTDLKP